MNDKQWCCLVFKGHYENAGARGFAVLIGRDRMGTPEFILQHRSIERGLEGRIFTESPLSLVSDIRISFCPWCGRHLRKWYSRRIDDLYRPGLGIYVQEIDGPRKDN